MRRQLVTWILPALLVVACGDDDSGKKSDGGQQAQKDGGGGGGGASCSISVTVEETAGAPKITTGKATVTCDKEALLQLKVCLQWETGAGFEDIICQTDTQSSVKTLEVTAESACGLSEKKYRTEATLTVDGAAQAPQTSQEITACAP
jgi:hypothetical protein